jgi:hypothetical protein
MSESLNFRIWPVRIATLYCGGDFAAIAGFPCYCINFTPIRMLAIR